VNQWESKMLELEELDLNHNNDRSREIKISKWGMRNTPSGWGCRIICLNRELIFSRWKK
ncbi:hypothetical protein HAX54_026309, partial [Datura stramonium]|nr:hypothetical protein [Datura stramonium]